MTPAGVYTCLSVAVAEWPDHGGDGEPLGPGKADQAGEHYL